MDDVLNEAVTTLTSGLYPADSIVPHGGKSVMVEGSWIPVDAKLWRSWTGRRAVWGMEYHGPVYSVESSVDTKPWDGPRECSCQKCQSHVAILSRPN